MYSTTGLGSWGWRIFPSCVMKEGQLFNIPASSNSIYDTGLYNGMWCFLPKYWCSNQGSGYFYFYFILLPFCVDSMRVIDIRIVLLIYWTFFRNKLIICYCYCCFSSLGGIVDEVSVALIFNTVFVHQFLTRVWHTLRAGYFWVLEFIHGRFNILGCWILYWSLLVVLFQNGDHTYVSISIMWGSSLTKYTELNMTGSIMYSLNHHSNWKTYIYIYLILY